MDEFYKGNVYNYTLEPTSPKGLHRYIDFYSLLPPHIQRRPDLMKVIYMFQDYLNDGYRVIPEPTVTHTYKVKNSLACDKSDKVKSYSEIIRPYDHDTSMYKTAMAQAFAYDVAGIKHIEEYNKERDLSTWSIDANEMESYLSENSVDLIGIDPRVNYSYYNEPRQYSKIAGFYDLLNETIIANPNNSAVFSGVTMFISTLNATYKAAPDEEVMSLADLKSLFELNTIYPRIEFNYYACDLDSFKTAFSDFAGNTVVKFSIEERKIPYFYMISDATDYNTTPPFVTPHDMTYDELIAFLPTGIYNSSFRVRFYLDVQSAQVADLTGMLDTIIGEGDFNLSVNITSLADMSPFVLNDIPCIASSLKIIPAYQHPEIFYSSFSYQNQYRHAAKGASIGEKIYRMAYSKDPDVFDYEYMNVIAQHFGYSMETDEEEINQNSYYKNKEEKELVLRQIVSNMPEYNRMKGTDSGIEMVLLSFGLVGRIISLYTMGDAKADGYAAFIDSRLISGDVEEFADATNNPDKNQDDLAIEMANQFKSHPKIGNTVQSDWYPSPHFRIEFDILKDNLNISRMGDQFPIIAKTIRKIKPINTVFQGFYAVLTAEYGKLFLNPPTILNKVHQALYQKYDCSFEDNWISNCELEVAP